MLRPSRRVTAVAGFAVVFAMATPAMASAHGSAHAGYGVDNRAGSVAAHRAAAPAAVAPRAGSPAITPVYAFPSASSTVIGSVGFIDAEQVGYFWSAARGDSVAQTFSGPGSVKKAIFKLDVPDNGLAVGAEVDWTASINGTDIGSFVVNQGVTGPITEKFKFHKITGPKYDVKIRVTNEVAGGDGAITLRYAGSGQHSVKLRH
jgi:hypothetical protein